MVFGNGCAGYCETDGEIRTFSFTVHKGRLTLFQECTVRRYRIIRGEDKLRLEGKHDSLTLRRQPTQNR